jgi:serine/threonine protein kinase
MNPAPSDPSRLDDLAARAARIDEALVRGGRVSTGASDLASSEAERLRVAHSCLNELAAHWPDSNDPPALSDFGRFRIVRELGRGSHGVVLLAEDPALGRKVALKVPRPELVASPEHRRRFLT